MSDAYNVRSDGKFYYVYKLDGNAQVSQHDTAAEAQRSAAIQNQRYNEQFGKKKQVEPVSDSPGFVEQQLSPEQGIGKGYSDVPNPPPGQGVNY